MFDEPFERIAKLVTTHNRMVILLMVVLTGAMVIGMTQLDAGGQAGGTDVFPDTTVSEKAEYVSETYAGNDESGQPAISTVYVRKADGNALSKKSLIEALEYQRTARSQSPVADPFSGVTGVPNLVATQLADEPRADLEDQLASLRAADPERITSVVRSTFTEGSRALALLPRSYDPGTATASSHRMFFRFTAADGVVPSDAQRVLFDAASERADVFTLGEHARAENSRTLTANTMELIVPFALVLIVGVLAFAYRDPVDVVVGMVGVVVSIVWMFGILGWLGVSAGMTMLIGPVLVAGLSIDFGFHIFTRYREQRSSDDGIRVAMRRGVRSVAIALGLVTVTAAVGFLSNVVNPVSSIRDLGIGITLGVAAAFLVFATLVPALKISLDGLLERVGLDRQKQPLGDGAVVRPLLASSVAVARRAAPLIVVLALVASAGGAVAWAGLEEETLQQQREPAAEWKQDLPEPLAWEVPDYQQQRDFVQHAFAPVASGADERFQILVEGDVAGDGALEAVAAVSDRPVFSDSRSQESLSSPVTVVRAVAADNQDFAATVDAADTDGNGVPDTDLEAVYDQLYAVAPKEASRVLERSDGNYRSLRILGPAESDGFTDDRLGAVRNAAGTIQMRLDAVTATAVSRSAVLDSQLQVVTDGVVRVLLLALGTVFVGLVLVYRRLHGSATLGALTAAPILMVTSLVVGGMYVLGVPLTLVTALLMSLVVGLGIDYNIHISDRFVQELERGRPPIDALETAVTGTGGALLGSTLTSAGAFAALLLHPHPQMQSFGVLVVLTLATSLVVSVVVLPSILTVWVRQGRADVQADSPTGTAAPSDD